MMKIMKIKKLVYTIFVLACLALKLESSIKSLFFLRAPTPSSKNFLKHRFLYRRFNIQQGFTLDPGVLEECSGVRTTV